MRALLGLIVLLALAGCSDGRFKGTGESAPQGTPSGVNERAPVARPQGRLKDLDRDLDEDWVKEEVTRELKEKLAEVRRSFEDQQRELAEKLLRSKHELAAAERKLELEQAAKAELVGTANLAIKQSEALAAQNDRLEKRNEALAAQVAQITKRCGEIEGQVAYLKDGLRQKTDELELASELSAKKPARFRYAASSAAIRKPADEAEAEEYLRHARKVEDVTPNVARIYYQMAARRLRGPAREEALQLAENVQAAE